MGIAMMQVRFPNGTVKYGSYQDTADVGSQWLTDDPNRYREMGVPECPMSINRNFHEPDVEVEVAVDYGGGFWGKSQSCFGHMLAHVLFYEQGGGGFCADIPANVTDIKDGLPDWWIH